MIPRLGDGNATDEDFTVMNTLRLENDSPSRGRKRERIMLDGYGTHKV